MPNNIAVAVTADVADLQVKRAILSSELKTASKDLNDFAKTANQSGLTDTLRTSMLASADAVARVRNQIANVDRQMKALSGGSAAAAGAMEGLHTGTAGVTRELIVLGREAARGNFSRMAGSATILTQRLGLLTPAVLGTGAVIAAIAAPIAIFLLAAEQGSQQLAKFKNAMEATNGYAGVTISQLQGMSQELANWGREGIGTATKELMALAASGQFTGQTLSLVGADATRMAQLTGESADKWNTEFEKMSDGVAKFAADFQARYGQLTTVQYTYIQQLEQQGQKESAEHALAKDVYDYLGQQAPEQLGYLEQAWRALGEVVADKWDQMKAIGRNSNADQIAAVEKQIDYLQAQKAVDDSGNYDAALAGAQKQLALLQAQEQTEERKAQAQAQSTAIQKDGVAAAQKLSEQFEASKTSGEKLKATLQGINDELKKAVAADPSNAAKYQQEAAAARAQAMKSDTPKAAGGDQVAQWEQQLHAQEVASQDFFSDQTQMELSFWQSKLSVATQGSKAWLDVQSKIYDLQKSLAHQAYDADLAALNDNLAADKDNWAKEQSDWNAKLAFIKAHYGALSTQYLEADKEFQAAERAHQAQMADIAKEAGAKALADLKANLDAQKAIRQENASAEEALIQQQARYSSNPLAEVAAAAQVGAIHQRLLQQQLADDQTYQAAHDALLQTQVDTALKAFGQESQNYQKAVDAKKQADQTFADQSAQLQNQMVVQSQQDALKVQQAWHSSVDPMVQSFGSGIVGMLKGTETLTQALQGVGETILNVIITSIERWVSAQIVAMITGQSTGKAAAASQVATNIALAGSGGIASMAAAPFPLDLTAPAFGAAMAAQAAALGSVASFDVGTNYVPNDMLAQIHEGERIVPKADNRDLMAAVDGGQAGGRPANDGGGDTHHWHINAIDARSFSKMLESNPDALARAAERSVRTMRTRGLVRG